MKHAPQGLANHNTPICGGLATAGVRLAQDEKNEGVISDTCTIAHRLMSKCPQQSGGFPVFTNPISSAHPVSNKWTVVCIMTRRRSMGSTPNQRKHGLL